VISTCFLGLSPPTSLSILTRSSALPSIAGLYDG
jgi:hypothetical protein